jgi:hypothetical protein
MAGSDVTVPNPGWNQDIQGMLAPFTGPMMWRLNLGDYAQVKANAALILQRITLPNPDMPPPPFDPFTQGQVSTFAAWLAHGCPLDRPAAGTPAPPLPAPDPTLVTRPPGELRAGNQTTPRVRIP